MKVSRIHFQDMKMNNRDMEKLGEILLGALLNDKNIHKTFKKAGVLRSTNIKSYKQHIYGGCKNGFKVR